MKKLAHTLLIVFLLVGWGCGKKNSQGLQIVVNPQRPILITAASSVNGASGGPTPPYFNVQNLTISWAGTQNFQLLALQIFNASALSSSTTGAINSFQCAGSGSILATLFAGVQITDPNTGNVVNVIDASGNVSLPKVPAGSPPIVIKSAAFFCSSVPVTINPNPFATYNVPVIVLIDGETLDDNGIATGRVNALTNITLQ